MMFSVIIPNYNHARFLRKRIDSVLNQSFVDFEVIILDDQSTDGSKEIIESYNDERISHKIFNTENSGSPFRQWKKGIELAKYDYIWIAESDDFCESDFLESGEKILKENPDVSLYYSDSHLIGENEEPYSNTIQKFTKELNPKLWNDDHKINGKEYVKKYLLNKNFILNASSVIFKKDLGIKAVENILEFKTSGDWLFYVQILQTGSVYFHAQKQNYFRHLLQSTRNYNTLEKRERRILEKIKINEFFFNHLDINLLEKKNIAKNLKSEWISNHLLTEFFQKGFFSITDFSFLNISRYTLIKDALFSKINNRWKN